jgi:hypothetical protein
VGNQTAARLELIRRSQHNNFDGEAEALKAEGSGHRLRPVTMLWD